MNSKLPNSAPKQPQTIQISDYGSQKSPSHDFIRSDFGLACCNKSFKGRFGQFGSEAEDYFVEKYVYF